MRCFNPFCSHKTSQLGPNCFRCGQSLQLGSFFARDTLGEGSLGATYLLENEQKTVYVLKTPNAEVLEDRQTLSQQNLSLHQEAKMLQSLGDWSGSPRFEGFGQCGEWHYLIEEYIEGPTLKEVAGVRSLNERELWILLDAILELLEHLAQQGIVHRDIKPDNLILTGSAERPLVLIDWGLSSSLEQKWEPCLGNPNFTAPEVLAGHSCLKSDLYSVGKLMIYLMLLTAHEINDRWSSHVPHLSRRLIETIDRLWLERKANEVREFRQTFIPATLSQQRQVLARMASDCW